MWKKSGAWYLNSLPAHSSQKHSIPMIKSPILSSIKDLSGKTVEPPSSPMVRRRQRSPSPMRHRNRSPEIAGLNKFNNFSFKFYYNFSIF